MNVVIADGQLLFRFRRQVWSRRLADDIALRANMRLQRHVAGQIQGWHRKIERPIDACRPRKPGQGN